LAISAASNGDIILVKPGTYNEFISFKGKAITVRSDLDANPATYDASPSLTIIDSNQLWSVVTFIDGEGPDSVLEGFTITNGFGTQIGPNDYGGGIYCNNSSPTIKYNIISNNSVDVGGGIHCEGSDPIISDNTIKNNVATLTAGGIMCSHASPTISNNTISANEAGTSGGGIEVFEFCTPKILNNVIKENLAPEGGGIMCYSASPEIINNLFKWNSAEYGGGIYCYASAPIITNNTIFENSGVQEGGGIYCFWYSFPIITNTILWNDNAPTGPEISVDSTSNPDVTYSDVQGGWTGIGNINNNPLFLDTSFGNLHLTNGSPCINGGDNSAQGLPAMDFDGENRVELTVDIGFDEFYAYPALELHVPAQYPTIQDAIDVATDGVEVLVASEFINEGDYVENIDFKGKAITLRSDADADPTTHDISPRRTVINGNQTGSTVSFVSGEAADSVLEGFTILNGSGILAVYNYYGGGIYCENTSPTITSNIIKWNATDYGGGICCEASSPIITSNIVEENLSSISGGGIMCSHSSPTISKNVIRNNSAVFGGGGIDLFQYCYPTITNNIILKNSADYGGGIECIWASPAMANNTFYENSGSFAGGGVYCFANSSPTIINTTFWNDNAPNGSEICLEGYSNLTISYCGVKGGKNSAFVESGCTLDWGLGMVQAAPGFLDPANGDFHLSWNAPYVNIGTINGAPSEDMDGDPRPIAGTVDIGADEVAGTPPLEANVYSLVEATGGTVDLTLNAGIENGNRPYLVLGSVTGTIPGTPLPGGQAILRLNWDTFTALVVNFMNTSLFANFQGTLDASGMASATFDTLGPIPGAAGLTLYFAYVLNVPWNYASNAVLIEIV
jgi:hypothetical protein